MMTSTKSSLNESEMEEEKKEETIEEPEGTTGEENSELEIENSTESESSAEDSESNPAENEQKDTEDEEIEDEIKSHPEFKELNDKYLRLYAEFDNFRRRSAKESIDKMENANADIIEKILPIVENLSLAFSPEQKASKLEDFEKGIKMIFNSFKEILEEAGLDEINPEGEEFDPNLHEALMEQNHDTVEEGFVIQVFQKGYKVKSKIIKHAKVIVSKGPEPKED